MSKALNSAVIYTVTALLGTAGFVHAQTPATQPSAAAAADPQSEFRTLNGQLREAKAAYSAQFSGIKDLKRLRDAGEREKLRLSLPALAQKAEDLEKQVAAARAAQANPGMVMMKPPPDTDAAIRPVVLVAVGDEATVAKVTAAAAGADANAAAMVAKAQLAAAKLFTAADAEAQLAAAKGLQKVLSDGGSQLPDADLLGAIAVMAPAFPDAADSVIATFSEGTPGKFTKSVIRQKESAAKSKQIENKPIVLTGTTVDGRAFSSESLKGKVVLVDFWATWCGPCKAELPRIKALYKQYHGQGFEIIGVSSDRSKDALTGFLAKDTDMSWTQLYEEPTDGDSVLHPIAKKYLITGIPRYFMIDRKGVLRSAEARQTMEELIPKLLAENVD